MSLESHLLPSVQKVIKTLYGEDVKSEQIQLQKTRPDFKGDITLVTFPFLKISKKSPEQTGDEIGAKLVQELDILTAYNIVKGFLNIEIADSYWLSQLNAIKAQRNFGYQQEQKDLMMVEYSSPNTNKPLHLGHLRNIFLGDSVSSLLKATGHKVVKTQIINDRGIHICKSMLAWQRFGEGETPQSSGLKGDKLVGKYYVEFDKALSKEREALLMQWEQGNFGDIDHHVIIEYQKLKEARDQKEDEKSKKAIQSKIKEIANNYTPIMSQVKDLLQRWESGDEEVVELWKKMNGWVYDGFNETYKQMQVTFDKLYYESDTYLTGKELVEKGLETDVFFRKEDGSIWINLHDEGLDEKLVLRADGTAVYMTQDIGTAYQRFMDYPDLNGIVYTVGNEQDYHFKVLFLILQKLGYQWAKNCHHLSYGMVDLPTGKMKSREGTVVDADDLIDEVVSKAREMTQERGHIEGMSDDDKEKLYHMIGLGGLKYYLLKVDPKKRMLFDPAESVDLNGNTGPFIQYAHARISSLLQRADKIEEVDKNIDLHEVERELIKLMDEFPSQLQQAAEQHSPALIANYVYDLVKMYNSFYQSISIFNEEDAAVKNMRLVLSQQVAKVIRSGMHTLGIQVPDRM